MEAKDKKSQAEDRQGHCTKDNHVVPPAHVARNCAACFSAADGLARGQLGITTPLRSGPVRDARRDCHTDGLPHGEKRDQEATLLGQELKRNRCINGDVASQTERCQEVDGTNGRIIEFRSGLWNGQLACGDVDGEEKRLIWNGATFDLARTKTLVARVKLYNSLGAPNIKDYHLLRPIPQTQIDRTDGGVTAFPQNPGY